MPKFQSLKGFRDFYPEEMARRTYILETWRRIASQHGFAEYDGPPLESLDLYRAKSGDEIGEQLYAFSDKGNREVAMRPEMTPTVARMVSARWQSLSKPVRWFSIPQLFRYERPQSGRLREHFQFNADIFGDPSPVAEAEVIALLIRTFKAFGLTASDVQIRLSDRRILNAFLEELSLNSEQSKVAYSVLDKFDREPRESGVARLRQAGIGEGTALRLIDTVEGLRGVKDIREFESRFGHAHAFVLMLYELHSMVDASRDWLTFDLAIVRGLEYYTGTVFEAFDVRKSHRAICGGGRYDGLLAALGDVEAPAVGFGWGDVVLLDLLRERGKLGEVEPGLDWVVSKHNAPLSDAWAIVRQLRDMEFSAVAIGASTNPKEHTGTGQTAARFMMQVYDDFVQFSEIGSKSSFKHRALHELLDQLRKKQLGTARKLHPDEVRGVVTDPKFRYRGMMETN